MSDDRLKRIQAAYAEAEDEQPASEQLSAVVGLLDKLSLDQVREADRELLLKFMRLCHHWHMQSQDEVNRRDAARKWAKRELKSLKSRK